MWIEACLVAGYPLTRKRLARQFETTVYAATNVLALYVEAYPDTLRYDRKLCSFARVPTAKLNYPLDLLQDVLARLPPASPSGMEKML